jgi:hypothetical protein
MAIRRIDFRNPVPEPIGSGYSNDKHGREFEVVEKGQWVIISARAGDKDKGVKRYRIPVTNVVAITEDDAAEVLK